MANPKEIPEGERLPHIYPTEFWMESEERVVKIEVTEPVEIITRDENGNQKSRVEDKTLLKEEVQYVNEDYVKWVRKGDTRTAVVSKIRLMKKLDPQAWKVIEPYYKAWKKGDEIKGEGTPLGNWPLIKNKRQVDQLKLMSIFTVEDLAEQPDANLINIGIGSRELRDKARAFVEAKQGTAKMAVLLQSRDEQIAKQDAQIAELTKNLAELTSRMTERKRPKDISKTDA